MEHNGSQLECESMAVGVLTVYALRLLPSMTLAAHFYLQEWPLMAHGQSRYVIFPRSISFHPPSSRLGELDV